VTLLQYRKYVDRRFKCAIVHAIASATLLGAMCIKLEVVHAQTMSAAPPGTSIVPALSVSERYDSNIWFAPSSLLPAGTQLWDFATTVQGGAKVTHKDRNTEVSLLAGVDYNAYVYNTGLNYLSTRADLYANLNGWAEQLVKGATLRLYDYFRYTPTSPGFLTGGKADTADPFLRGIQSFRANTFSNTLNTDGFVPVFRDLGVQGGYAFSMYRVGSPINTSASGTVQFFDTTVHTFSIGPRLQMTRQDGVGLLYQRSQISQAQAQTQEVTAAPIDTTTQSVTATYNRATPNWTFNVGGGVTVVEPVNLMFPTGSIAISNNPERATTVQLSLSRQASPSFFISAGAMISNVVQIQVVHRPTRLLTLRGSANYGYNEIVPKTADTSFTNFSLSGGINYKLTKTMSVDLFYDHNDFKTESPGLSYVVLRDAAGLALTVEWK
jgi:opacity protein-like surface antigen